MEDSGDRPASDRGPSMIDSELVGSSITDTPKFALGDHVMHLKFDRGTVPPVESNTLAIGFDTAGQKHVVDSFIERA